MDKRQKAAKDLTLMLLYLNSWEEKGLDYRRAWKGYDFDTLNELSDDGLIMDGRRSKSVGISEEGIERALQLLREYGMEDD
jgi:hypothetical protein